MQTAQEKQQQQQHCRLECSEDYHVRLMGTELGDYIHLSTAGYIHQTASTTP